MYVTIYVTVPDKETAKKIARILLEERLVACANIIDNLYSMYWWENKIKEKPECLMIMKTKLGLFEKLEARVKELHPYQVPEIISMPIVKGYPPYLHWLSSQTRATHEDNDFHCVQF